MGTKANDKDKVNSKNDQTDATRYIEITLQVITPLLVLFFGAQISNKLDQDRLRAQQVEVASKMLDDVFAQPPAPGRVLIALKLMGNVLDKDMQDELKRTVGRYYVDELLPKVTGRISVIMPLEKRMAIKEISDQLQDDSEVNAASHKLYHVVVDSTSDKAAAIARAQELQGKGYASEIYLSNNKRYAITIGRAALFDVLDLLERAQKNGDARDDAYLTIGPQFQPIPVTNAQN
jgi:hypothetical protein